MANVIVTVPVNNITVDATNSVVTVANTTSNVIVSETPVISNASIRTAISVSNESGFGNLAYDTTVTSNGIIQYTGVSTADIRDQISLTDAGGDGSASYNTATGVITYVGPNATNYRAAISLTDAGGDGSASYNSATGVITYTGVSAAETRAHFSATAPMQYSNGTGVISIDSDAVFSGKTTDDLAQGTANKYFTTSGAVVNTDALPEGTTNKYYTDARSRSAISGANGITYNSGTGVIELTDADVISGVTAGLGLDGGGTTGNITLNVDVGPGIIINGSNEVALDTTNLVTLTGAQDITGLKTFDGGLIVQGPNSGSPVPFYGLDATFFLNGTGGSFTSNVSNQFNNHDVSIYRGDINMTMEGTGPGATTYKTNTLDSSGMHYYGNVDLLPRNTTSNTWIQSDMSRIRETKTNYLFIGGTSVVGSNVLYGAPTKAALVQANSALTAQGSPRFDVYSANGNEWAEDNRDAITNATLVGQIVDTYSTQSIGGAKIFTQDLSIQGNLDVAGNLNYVEVQDLLVRDNTITLNYGNTSVNTTSGIYIDRTGYPGGGAANVGLRWQENLDRWELSDDGTNYFEIITTNNVPAGGVTSVNTLTGDVVLDTDDILEGTNKYYAEALFDASLATKTTNNLAEGTNNKYYSDVLSRNALSTTTSTAVQGGALAYNASTGVFTYSPSTSISLSSLSVVTEPAVGGGELSYDFTDGEFHFAPAVVPVASVNSQIGVVVLDTDDIAEGTNLYYTDARSQAALSVTTAAASGDGSLTYNNTTGVFTFTPADAGLGDYGNVQVADFLANGFGSNTITTSGDITTTGFFEGDLNGAVTIDVYNNTGVTLARGDAVYLTGSNNGDTPHVALADSDDPAKMPALGIVRTNIAAASVGQVVTSGVINDAMHGYALGADLYVDTTAGGLTATIPTGENNLIQKIGKVVSANHIMMQGAFRTNATPNLNQGNIFIGDATNASITSTLSTSIVPEGTNEYFTDARADARVDLQTGVNLDLSFKSTTDLAEGTNLYYTDARSQAALSVTTATPSGDGSLAYDNATGVFTFTPVVHTSGTEIVNGTSNVTIANADGNITLQVGNFPVAQASLSGGLIKPANGIIPGIDYTIVSIGTTDFTLIGAASNTVGLLFTATAAGVGSGTASEPIRTDFIANGNVQANFMQIASADRPVFLEPIGLDIRQASDDSANVFASPRVNLYKFGGGTDFVNGPLTTVGLNKWTGSVGASANRGRVWNINPNYGGGVYSTANVQTATSDIISSTGSTESVVTGAGFGGDYGGGQYLYATADVTPGIMLFRTAQIAVAQDLALTDPFFYGNLTQQANSTVAYIDDTFHIGREDDSNLNYSFPKTPGTTDQILKLDANLDLQWSTDAGGIALTDLSVTTAAASGDGSLAYDDTTGVFTFTPAVPGGAASYSDANVITLLGNYTNNIVSTANITTSGVVETQTSAQPAPLAENGFIVKQSSGSTGDSANVFSIPRITTYKAGANTDWDTGNIIAAEANIMISSFNADSAQYRKLTFPGGNVQVDGVASLPASAIISSIATPVRYDPSFYGGLYTSNADIAPTTMSFRTTQLDVANALVSENDVIFYTNMTTTPKSTVMFIDSQFHVGTEEANSSYSFPKLPGLVNQVLQLDANYDLQWVAAAGGIGNALVNVNSITPETNIKAFTVKGPFGANNIEIDMANVTSDGYAVFPGNQYTPSGPRGSYTGTGDLTYYGIEGSTTSGSPTITVTAIRDGSTLVAGTLADLNTGYIISNYFDPSAYVQSIDTGAGTITMSKNALSTNTFAYAQNTKLSPAVVDQTTGLVVYTPSVLEIDGSGSYTTLKYTKPLNIKYGYPASGFANTDFSIYAVGNSSEYTFDDDTSFTVARSKVSATNSALNAPLGITIGENTDLSQNAENDLFRSFGITQMWDGLTGVSDAIQPGIVAKSYTQGTFQQYPPNLGSGASRLFFSSAHGTSNDDPYTTYPRADQELGRLAFWGTTGQILNPSSFDVPAYMSVAAANDWSSYAGGVAGNTNVYFASTSDGVESDTYISYKSGELVLGSGSSKSVTFAPAAQVDGQTPQLAYEGSFPTWANVNYANVGSSTGAKFTVTNGGAVNAATGDLEIGIKRKNNGGGDSNVEREWKLNLANGSQDLVVSADGNTNVTFTDTASIFSNRVRFQNLDTTAINALTGMSAGDTVYNTTEATLCFYNGSAWHKVTSTAL